jgi:hypothetical protein
MTQPGSGPGTLLARGTFLVRGGYVMTMDSELADMPACFWSH